MAHIVGYPQIILTIELSLAEPEAKALYLLSSYNPKDVMKNIEGMMGPRVLKDHEIGLTSLLTTVRQPLSIWLDKVIVARKVFEKEKE